MCDSILPFYLKNIAYDITQKREKISFKTECSCGCRLFDFYKNVKTDEEKLRETKWASLCKEYNGASLCDNDGNVWLYSKSF